MFQVHVGYLHNTKTNDLKVLVCLSVFLEHDRGGCGVTYRLHFIPEVKI